MPYDPYQEYISKMEKAQTDAAKALEETFKGMVEPVERVKDAMNHFGFKVHDWQEKYVRAAMENETLRQQSPRMQGKQDYPTDEDEVCCLCHEDVGGGYPPAAFERGQAPYTYIDDLQGWAHDACAKEYFKPQDKVSDLKPSRTEQLP